MVKRYNVVKMTFFGDKIIYRTEKLNEAKKVLNNLGKGVYSIVELDGFKRKYILTRDSRVSLGRKIKSKVKRK